MESKDRKTALVAALIIGIYVLYKVSVIYTVPHKHGIS